MNIRKKAGSAAGIVAIASILALAATGCRADGGGGGEGGEASPGITDSEITLAISTPLSGNTAGPGNCSVAGIVAYFGAKNDEGGIEFGDGKTRTVSIEALDDTYDPQKALANFQQNQDDVFAFTAGIGTPTNRAYREAAIDAEVPQVLVMTGDPIFSDQEESPWQLGFVPAYQNEGEAFGELLASSDEDLTVAILAQNDDYGDGYVEGFTEAIEGADNIEVVKELSYEATDTSVDAQVTELAATDADVFFTAMPITPLTIAALQKARELGWEPSWFLPSNTSSPGGVLEPAGIEEDTYPGIYTVSFAKATQSPTYAEDEDVVDFLAHLEKYSGDYTTTAEFPHCAWSYMMGATLDQAFQKMTEPTRENFMEALRGISNFQAPLMLEGTAVDTTEDGQPAVSSVVVQKFNGAGYDNADSFD